MSIARNAGSMQHDALENLARPIQLKYRKQPHAK
jgi:hypothetical protein